MTRVIAGAAGGRRLAVPAGRDTRPTSDRAREGLFASISSIVGPLTGKRVLDLYAGSGAVGLEALSRGAEHVLLVESAGPALRVIRANVESLGLPGAEVAADRVERLLARGPAAQRQPYDRPYDIVFADPPYAMADSAVTAMLRTLAAGGWLAAGALVIVERASRSGPPRPQAQADSTPRPQAQADSTPLWPEGYQSDRVRRYGEATFWYGLAPGAQ
jgi:16S rRNA (guanine966-N2)-methyltransferase